MASDPKEPEVSEPQLRPGEEGRFAGTWQNKAAGRVLRAARLSVPREDGKQANFASALSEQLGIPISPTTLSGWETGRRTVPAPVWMAAAFAASQSLDALLSETGGAEVTPWAESLGLLHRLEAQQAEIHQLRDELQELRQQQASLYARLVEALTRA